MITKLSLLLITKNAQELLENSLNSCKDLVGEIIVVDNNSKDNTREILKKYQAKIYQSSLNDLGQQRAYGLSKVKNEWVLILDSDEVISDSLKKEIIKLLKSKFAKSEGYLIPFQNHFLGRPVNYGGENYKMLRLFKKKSVTIGKSLVHESFSENMLEYPQYTRPEVFNKQRVPKVLLTGHHANIQQWRMQEALKRTKKRRPDLLK